MSELPERLSALFPAPRRFRRAVGGVAAALGLTVVFGVSFVGATLLHLNLAPTRRVGRVVASRILGHLFQGEIRVGDIDQLAYDHVEIRDARIFDPDGNEVIRAHRLVASFSTLHLLKSLFWANQSGDPLWIAFPKVQIEDGTVTLIPKGGTNAPTIGETFLLRSPPPPTTTPGRPVILTLPRIEIAHVDVHGMVGRPIDATVQRLTGSVGLADRLVMVDVEPTGLVDRAFLPAQIDGVASYHLRVDTDRERVAKSVVIDADGSERHKEPVDMWIEFAGGAGDIPIEAAAELEGNRLAAKADLPKVTPEAVHAIFPPVPLVREVNVEVRARGVLPELRFGTKVHMKKVGKGNAPAGEGTLVARGKVDLRSTPRLEVAFESNEINPRDLFDALPEAQVSGQGVLRVVAAPDTILASLEASTLPGTVGSTTLPAMDIIANLHRNTLVGSATIDEPGAPVDARFNIDDTGRIAFGAHVESDDLRAAPRLAAVLGVPASGGAMANVTGTLDKGQVKADVVASMGSVSVGSVGVDRAYVTGHVEGPVADVTVQAAAQAEGVHVDGRTLDHAKVDVQGRALSPRIAVSVEDATLGKIDAHAAVNVPDKTVSNVEFNVARGGASASGKVTTVQISPSGVDVRGIEIEGADVGKVHGAVRIENGDVVGSLTAEGIHLDKVATLAGLPAQTGGVANVDVAVEHVAGKRRGHVEIEIQGGRYWLMNGIAARLSAKFDGDNVETAGFVRVVEDAGDAERKRAKEAGPWAEAELCDGPIASLVVSDASGTLKGPLLSLATWKKAIGEASVSADDLNLHCVMGLVPGPVRSLLPISDASGIVSTRARIVRHEEDPYPSIRDGYLKTHGLAIVGPTSILGFGQAAWDSRRIDVEVHGSLDGTTGHVSTDSTFFDGALLADLSAEADLDLGHALAAIEHGTFAKELESAPISAHLDVPDRAPRAFDTLPSFLRSYIPPVDGDVRLEASFDGSIEKPTVSLTMHGNGLKPGSGAGDTYAWVPTVDADVAATYTPDSGRAVVEAHVGRDGKTIASVNGEVDVPASAIIHPTGGPIPWNAGFYLTIFAFPLETLAPLADREISGHVTGTLAVSGINDAPAFKLAVSAPDLKLGDSVFDAEITSESGKPPTAKTEQAEKGEGTLHFALDGGANDGLLTADATAGLDGLVLDKSRPADVDVRFDQFELGAFTPLVTPILTRIGGKLDGEVNLHMNNADLSRLSEGRLAFPTPSPSADAPRRPGQGARLAGLTVRDAVVFIPQLGQELHGGVADITAAASQESDATVIQVRNLEAHGASGLVRGTADATFHGLAFDHATGNIEIPAGEELPVTFEGVPLGQASGNLSFNATHPEDGVSVDIKVPIIRFDLPQSSNKNVEDLSEDPTIHTKELLAAPTAPRGPNATHYHLNVELDRGEIGGGLEAVVKSSPTAPITVDLQDKLTVGGEISIDSGSITLQNKKFEVEHGLIRLRPEEPGNPYINLTARWDGPDGGRVYVDYVGNFKPMTDDKIRFRSDPPRSKEDIIATLLFGTDLSSTPQGGAPAGSSQLAASVGSTLASQALKSLVSSKYVTLSVDQNSEGGFRGTVEWRASQGLTLGVSGEQVQAQPGTSTTSQAGGAQGELSLEWKFLPNWSLRSSFGAGSQQQSGSQAFMGQVGVDVLWQYKY